MPIFITFWCTVCYGVGFWGVVKLWNFCFRVKKGNQVFMRDLGLGGFYKARTPGAHFWVKIFVIYWESESCKSKVGAHPGAHFGVSRPIIFWIPESYIYTLRCAPGCAPEWESPFNFFNTLFKRFSGLLPSDEFRWIWVAFSGSIRKSRDISPFSG